MITYERTAVTHVYTLRADKRVVPCAQTAVVTIYEPDGRWANILGGFGDDGQPQPMTLTLLKSVAADWPVTGLAPEGVNRRCWRRAGRCGACPGSSTTS